MAFPKKYNTVIINALLAVVACGVVNFSYLLAIREQDDRDRWMSGWLPEGEDTPHTGRLHVSKDGYGYILCDRVLEAALPDSLLGVNAAGVRITGGNVADEGEAGVAGVTGGGDSIVAGKSHVDSIYVVSRLIRRLSLVDGSMLTVIAREPRTPGANSLMWKVLEIDGVPFDYGELYNNPRDRDVMVLQLVYYILFVFVLLTIMTAGAARNISLRFYLTRGAYAIVAAVVFWALLPVLRPRSGELVVTAMNLPLVYPIDVMKCSFLLIFAMFYGRTYQLLHQRDSIMLENERLKSENLAARYNTLVNQINPHFLFNSLNSLSALVREGKDEDAVKYIDRLSDTFRYTIRNEPNATTTLGEELEFVAAYKYLLEVRYAEKLFVDIEVEADKLGWLLPTFSIQPLVENAVKHNSITRARPLRISIRTEGERLVVSNPVIPKIEPEKGTGIGLENLSHRWLLLTGQDIEVKNDGERFTVALPFIKTTL